MSNALATLLQGKVGEIEKIIPRGMSAERMVKVTLACVAKTPKLRECSPASIYVAMHNSVQLGLEPGGPLQEAHLVPFRNGKSGGMDCQFIIGYRGLLALARRSGAVKSVYAYVVREGDDFVWRLGLNPDIQHVPAGGDGRITHAYAVAMLKDGGHHFEVMTRDELIKIKQRSKASGSGPWVTDFSEMCRKTVLRRLCKFLPMSVEAMTAIHTEAEQDIKDVPGQVIEPIQALPELAMPKRRGRPPKKKSEPESEPELRDVTEEPEFPVGEDLSPPAGLLDD